MRLDAHQHYWKIDRGDYGWITPQLPVLYRDFGPGDLEPLLQKHGIDGSIVVQAAPTVDETRYILELAEQSASILGVVGWLDLSGGDHRRHYEEFRRNPKFCGFRLMIQDMPDATVILEPSFVNALQSYAAENVPVDLLVTSDQLEAVRDLLRQVPNLRGVIDHIGKPPIAGGEMEPWLEHMKAVSANPGIYCKLSGMVTEADSNAWTKEEFGPYIRHVLEIFGPHRVMFGSDWPVCLLAADYDQVLTVLEHSLPESWGEQERGRLFGWNAMQFYNLS